MPHSLGTTSDVATHSLASTCLVILTTLAFGGCGAPSEEQTRQPTIDQIQEPTCTMQPGPTYGGGALWPAFNIPYAYYDIPGDETSGFKLAIRQAMNAWQAATSNRFIFTLDAANPEHARINNIYSGQACTESCSDPNYPFCNTLTQRCSSGGQDNVNQPCSATCSSDFPLCHDNPGSPATGCRKTWGCQSSLGWEPGAGPQDTWLADGQCGLLHELGHLIGFAHEHQRIDRDRYVVMHSEAQSCNDGSEWLRVTPTEDDTNNVGKYDLSSVMQYGSAVGPDGLADMTRRDNGQLITTANGSVLSENDGADALELYSRERGAWNRSVSMGIDVGATAPLSHALATNVSILAGSSPAVARTSTTMDVFVRGSDNNIYRRTTSPYGKPVWGAWSSIGGNANSNPGTTVSNGKQVVAVKRSDGDIYIAESPSWAWSSVGNPPGSVTAASNPVLVSALSTQLDVLVRGSDNALWQRRRNGSTWDAWVSRGGSIAGTPAAVAQAPSVVSVFANSATNDLKSIQATGPNWSNWATVPNDSCCLKTGSGPAVVAPNPNRLDVLVRGTDDRLWWKRWDAATGWTFWWALGGIVRSNPAAGAGGTARIDAFFVSDDNALWYRQHRANRPKGDWDGDGLGDFWRWEPANTRWQILTRPGAAVVTIPFLPGFIPGIPDDFDADGRADPVALGATDRTWKVRRNTAAEVTTQWGLTSDRFLNGDYNGDGLADFVIFRPSNGNWYISPGWGYAPFRVHPTWAEPWGTSSDIMVPGDYDGDQKTDVALYRPNEGRWYVIKSSTHTQLQIQLGSSTDIPVPGDYDGDGLTDAAVYSPSNGNWLMQWSSSGGVVSANTFRTAQDRPVQKDYDGDGKTDPAVFSPSDGFWFVLKSTGGTRAVSQWGIASDVVF